MGVCYDCKNESVELFNVAENEDHFCELCHSKRLQKGKTSSAAKPRDRGRPQSYRYSSDNSGIAPPRSTSSSRRRSMRLTARCAGASRSRSPCSRPTGLIQPSTSGQTAEPSYSTNRVKGSVKITSLVKLRHLETISTPDRCLTVTFNPDSQVLHGGRQYDFLNGARDGLSIDCIRIAPDNQVIMIEKNCETETTVIVTYQLDENATLVQKPGSKETFNTAYNPIKKIQAQYCGGYITQFTKLDDILIQTGGGTGKLYFYTYSTGELIREVSHSDMKCPRGICQDTNSDIYVTDSEHNSIFVVKLNKEGSPSVTELSCEISGPMRIASHDGFLSVLSKVGLAIQLHVITTTGEIVKTIELRECKSGLAIHDLSINTKGVVAIANSFKGVQLYKFQ